MVGHLSLEDGTVLRHIKHGDLITDVLVFGLRRKDPLREGPHLVIGLCQAQQRYVASITEMHSAPIISCSTKLNILWLQGQPQSECHDCYSTLHEYDC